MSRSVDTFNGLVNYFNNCLNHFLGKNAKRNFSNVRIYFISLFYIIEN